MLKTMLAATAAFMLVSGAGFAQSTYSTSTTVTTPPVAPIHHADETTTTSRTNTRNGVLIEKDTTGEEVSSPGAPGTSQTTTETTRVR
jgi:hypothetical protein